MQNYWIEIRVEMIVTKVEIGHHKQFLLLTQCFQKSYAADASKIVWRWKKGILGPIGQTSIFVTARPGKIQCFHVAWVRFVWIIVMTNNLGTVH